MNTDSAFGSNCIECNANLDFDDFCFNQSKQAVMDGKECANNK